MKNLWDALIGIGAALTTTLLVVGAMLLALTEGMVLPAAAQPPTAEPPVTLETFFPGFATPTPRPSPTSRLAIATAKPAAQLCSTPSGWERITLAGDDTLTTLAEARGVSRELLMEKNCLVSATLIANKQLYLPPLPPSQTPQPLTNTVTVAASLTPSVTPVRCGAPRGWVRYTVQFGDTLFRLSTIFNVSVPELQLANCLGWSSIIRAGEILYVPNVTPRYTVTLSATPVPPTATRTLIPTGKPSTATFTPIPATRTFTPVFTATFTPVFTATFTTTFTATFTPTDPSTPTATGTNSPAPTSTQTATSTSTPTGK
jgi:LysM repeat protein